jgi:hypothetical protein
MKSKHSLASLLLLIGLVIVSSSRPVFAQSSACVNLLVGAGYAAYVEVVWQGGSTGWSSSFPIGKTKCQPLSGVPVGTAYTVKVAAMAGKTVDCSPKDIVKTASGNNPVFNAWGQTLNVHCEMPGNEASMSEMDKASTPSAEGKAAAKKAMEHPTPPPDDK